MRESHFQAGLASRAGDNLHVDDRPTALKQACCNFAVRRSPQGAESRRGKSGICSVWIVFVSSVQIIQLSASEFPPDLLQDILHLIDDLGTLQRPACLVFRIGLEQRPHPFGHARQFSVTLLSKDPPIMVESLV
jgi:hypothetical protein